MGSISGSARWPTPATAAPLGAVADRQMACARGDLCPGARHDRRGPEHTAHGPLLGRGRDVVLGRPALPRWGAGEALNVVNARYGNEPGLTAYSHVSDQYAPFATQ